MRTFMALAAALASGLAAAHEGHGEAPLHTHSFDLLGLGALIAAVAWWLWRRSQR